MPRLKSGPVLYRLLAAGLVIVVAAAAVLVLVNNSTKSGVAYFESVKSV